MPRFYDPTTGTEALEGIHDTTNATAQDAMPEAAREWFERPAADGKQWVNDPTNTYPVEVDIPPPTNDELKAIQRQWVQSELLATDPALLPDSPYTDDEQTQLKAYRTALRNPARESANGFPDESWRPTWPEGVKRVGV